MAKFVEGHDTERSAKCPELMVVGPLQAVPSYRNPRPMSSTAMQNVAEEHETDIKYSFGPSIRGGLHVLPSKMSAAPAWSTAAQNWLVGHEIDDT